MTEDKKLFYHFLKNLHFQTEYLHFIYRNTNRSTMQQRQANFWRGAQVPSIFLAIINVYIIFLTQDWVIGGLTLLISVIVVYFLGSFIYNKTVKYKNKLEEEKMDFNTTLIYIQNSRDQVEIIDTYNINNMDAIKKAKIDEIEDLIEEDLCEVFNNFNNKSKKEVTDFLWESSLDFPRFRGRLERLQSFMENKSVDYSNKSFYKKLNAMVKYLEALEDDNESEAKKLINIILKERD